MAETEEDRSKTPSLDREQQLFIARLVEVVIAPRVDGRESTILYGVTELAGALRKKGRKPVPVEQLSR